MKLAQDIIIRPIITEASMDNIQNKKYTFAVHKDATKADVAAAVEALFGVEVEAVNTVNVKRKPKRMGVHAGYTAAWKKAIVTLTESSKTIEFFDGMQ